eukprot:gene5209-7247_t
MSGMSTLAEEIVDLKAEITYRLQNCVKECWVTRRKVIGGEKKALAALIQGRKRISDGLPELEQIITSYSGSIPSPREHANCECADGKFLIYDIPPLLFKTAESRIWGSITVNKEKLSFATEVDIVHLVLIVLEDVIKATNLEVRFSGDICIKHIAPDICILSYECRLVGVVQVEKNGKSIRLKPTVLGELLDQLLLVEGFYRSGPVIRILTTLEKWLFAWFPADADHFVVDDENVKVSETSIFLTPIKYTNSQRHSLLGNTPSQISITGCM